MFYVFHHMPKCGGTSFRTFLESVFTVVKDQPGGGGPSNKVRYQRFLRKAPNLTTLADSSCLSGHYNLPETFLWKRFPQLENFNHKKFTILREPFDTAQSGIFFNIKRGRIKASATELDLKRHLMKRTNYFARVLGIESADQIDEVFDRYWFLAPLDRIADAARLIELETDRKGTEVGHINTTSRPETPFGPDVESEFKERAKLDIEIFARAKTRFDDLYRDAQVK